MREGIHDRRAKNEDARYIGFDERCGCRLSLVGYSGIGDSRGADDPLALGI